MRYRTLVAVVLALCLGLITACSGSPRAGDQALSYDQIKGSGLANLCPQISETRRDAIAIAPNQSYTLEEMCLQPTAFLVKQEPLVKRASASQATQFMPTKPLTRASFSIDQVSGVLKADADGRLTFMEQSGFDFQPITVQLPDGERVPLLFSIKGLVAQTLEAAKSINPLTQFSGTFQVPAYRTAGFLDPKGRGVMVGYDAAVGLPPQADSKEFQRSNTKVFEVDEGTLTLRVERVDQGTGEIAGVFESIQPSDTDFGAKDPMDVKIQGVFYARLNSEMA
ncbi:photosystem II manganese-stabilizing polypeptide [Nodosilinea sp. LEGE 07088]|uniref:photosystem II manganese-stabilizing polypeptide n=1 Tax=Nodosilinea sp. LEGE 07088 TaxID=2777968 RepID=UPI001882C075|nr:photosystem II manganese-stabilizing polypeptide [Nodosilinea sp. LEGE 07088]MBE9138370.1 photosystem II manganese-stabilizing polypeptide [Nodosilinea sp. LEGE 07088]